jgi:hypothetical protein
MRLSNNLAPLRPHLALGEVLAPPHDFAPPLQGGEVDGARPPAPPSVEAELFSGAKS